MTNGAGNGFVTIAEFNPTTGGETGVVLHIRPDKVTAVRSVPGTRAAFVYLDNGMEFCVVGAAEQVAARFATS
ncbi:hypothetical protein [Caenispirillum bisanense]|uniref:hypothetical protein n=1 Tax=Caenispirillum bisanense TaxID=414052 RepID=UPI0031D20187